MTEAYFRSDDKARFRNEPRDSLNFSPAPFGIPERKRGLEKV